MPASVLRSAVVLMFARVLLAAAQERTPPAWPPAVQKVDAASPALSPEAERHTFRLPPGYRVELVASEPLIEDPVWIDIDAAGRLWVVEMRGYMPDAAARGEREPVGRIVVLEDDDDDGRMDRRTVFLDGLVLARSIEVLDRGVLVAEPPHVWLARDTNGDLRADTKELVRDDYGRGQGNPEHNANGLMWGLDNWIHTSEHDGSLRLRNGQWEHRRTLQRGQWGVSMDDVGRVYRNWNEDPLLVDLVSSHYFVRNPNLARTRGAYEPTMDDMTVWPVRPTPGVNRGYRPGTLRDDGSLRIFNAAGTPVVYRGDRLPADLRGNVFVTEPAGNLVRRLVVTDDGAGRVRAKNAYARGEFLASTDERFRPVNLYSAPDGTLYVVDMYRGIIQHNAYQSEYLRNYVREHALAQPVALGRIFRVVHESTVREKKPALAQASSRVLVELLAHPNGWWRDTAQRLLVERGDRSVDAVVRERAATAPDARTRLHALWTLEGLGALEPGLVERALKDRSPQVRAAAVRVSEPWIRPTEGVSPSGTSPADAAPFLSAAIVAMVDDPDLSVRRQVAATLGELPEAVRELALGTLLDRHGDDPVVVDVVISGARGRELVLLDRLLRRSARPAGGPMPALRDDAVAMLSAAIVKSGQSDAILAMLQRGADPARVAWQRRAVLRGAELGLPGAERLAALRAEEAGGAATMPHVAIEREPATLVALAKTGRGDLRAHAVRLVKGFDWPGKPKPATEAPPPLGPEQQRHFVAGREVYQNLCAACHQAEGTGLAGLAPPLVGSKWVIGRAGLAARIVLQGKEGQTTLMPPLGATLSDDQVAAVLTYVRRSWGHGASPVEGSLVREVRGASTGRERPWTEAELAKVTQPDGAPSRP